jgi:hypothetical protein
MPNSLIFFGLQNPSRNDVRPTKCIVSPKNNAQLDQNGQMGTLAFFRLRFLLLGGREYLYPLV